MLRFLNNGTKDAAYRKEKSEMIPVLKEFLATKGCRRELLLSHFEQQLDTSVLASKRPQPKSAEEKKKCCDNCAGTNRGIPLHQYRGRKRFSGADFVISLMSGACCQLCD